MILIVGSSRSGTTWLAKIFDSHPEVLYRHEPDSVLVKTQIPFIPEPGQIETFEAPAAHYLAELAAHRSLKSIGSLPVFAKRYRGAVGSAAYRGLILALKGLSGVVGRAPWLDRRQYPDLILMPRPAPVTVIKSVNSISRTPLFCQADPSLKVIHILRHPCGRIASLLRGRVQGIMGKPTDVTEIARTADARARGLSEDVMAALSREAQSASHWMVQNDKVMEELEGNERYRCLRYEDLCAEPERVARELFAFAELDWDPQCARFLAQSQSDGSAKESYFGVVRDPMKAAEQWRQELDGRQIDDILAAVKDSRPGRLYAQPAEDVVAKG